MYLIILFQSLHFPSIIKIQLLPKTIDYQIVRQNLSQTPLKIQGFLYQYSYPKYKFLIIIVDKLCNPKELYLIDQIYNVDSLDMISNCKDFNVLYTNVIKLTQLCVLYLHGYNGSRLEAVPYANAILQSTMDLCTFDFQAAGQSEGDFVTFGFNEQLNVVLLADFLQAKYQNIILWGRSMGATTALMYAIKHQNICCLILDSPFIVLEDVILNIIKDKLGTPDLINKGLFQIIKRQILQLYKFSISSVKLPQCLNSNCPMLLLASKFDTLIPYHHFTTILDSYQGQKQMIHLYNNHNELRSKDIISTVIGFIQSTIQPIKHNPTNRFIEDIQSHQYVATGIKIKQKIMRNQSDVNQSDIISNKNSVILQKHKALLQLSNIE